VNEVERWVQARLGHAWAMAEAHAWWQLQWGVPCGPTLTQVPGHGVCPAGIVGRREP